MFVENHNTISLLWLVDLAWLSRIQRYPKLHHSPTRPPTRPCPQSINYKHSTAYNAIIYQHANIKTLLTLAHEVWRICVQCVKECIVSSGYKASDVDCIGIHYISLRQAFICTRYHKSEKQLRDMAQRNRRTFT